MAPLERRNGWTLVEQAGDGTPDAMQALLCSPCFDRDALRDEVRCAVVEAIGTRVGCWSPMRPGRHEGQGLGSRGADGLTPLTSNEIRRLFAKLILTVQHAAEHILAWSAFRQLCNRPARAAHYPKRLDTSEGTNRRSSTRCG